jgi:leucyl aminopeptidase
MKIVLDPRPYADAETGALAVLAFEGDAAPAAGGAWLAELMASGEFAGKLLDTALTYNPQGLKAKRLLVVGGGKRASFTPFQMRRAAGTALRSLKPKGVGSIALLLEGEHASPEFAAAAVEGAILGDFEPDAYKTKKEDSKTIEQFAVLGPETLAEAVESGRIVAECQNFTRALVNEPANRMSPMILADRAREMAAECGLECEVLDRDRMRQLGMGALLGVAQGSAEAPALIVVRYRPAGAGEGAPHLGLIGKAVTFDSGGISIKPSDGMEKMKYDMAGGAAVLGVMRALAHLKPALAVTAFVPAVENMPGSRAQRPGDIVTSLSGKTIEVLNTDAEGRLILADAMTYARRQGCTHLVDAATLTGAIVVALGHINVGVFASDEPLAARLMQAAAAAGEKMWRMPLDDEYRELLKTPFADIPNIGNRWGGAITAAAFLQEFAEDTPWAHLDIAGTAWLEEGKPFMAKGPTGVAVRTLVQLARSWS